MGAPVNVLADFHHSGLWHSWYLLGQRLGWTVYAPRGMEWWESELWSFGRSTYLDDRLARQFLHLPEFDGEFPDVAIPQVTLDEARTMDWSYVIATVPDNEQGFARFAREHDAKYVVGVGNTGQYVDWSLDPLALVSSEMPIEGRGIVYHQEIDPTLFVPTRGIKTDIAASFVNCMTSMGACWDRLVDAKALGMIVNVYGIDGPEGIVKPYEELTRLMGFHDWGWHDKAQGDGFGHVIHSWAAVGRPLVGHSSHYFGKLAEHFWRDGETCIDLDRHPVEEAVDIIRSTSPARHAEMCRAIRAEFDTIDYAAEAEAIRAFLA